MKIISFVENPKIIRKILKYLNLWDEERDSQLRTARDPPRPPEMPDEIVYVPVEDAGWEQYENPGFTGYRFRDFKHDVSKKESFYSEFREQVKNHDLLNILPGI